MTSGTFEIELGYAYDCEKKLAEKGLPGISRTPLPANCDLRSNTICKKPAPT